MVALGTIAAMLFALSGYYAAVGLAHRHRRRPIMPRTRQYQYTSRWATSEADAAAVYEFFCDQLDDRSEVSMDLIRELYSCEPETLHLVERHDRAESRLVGIVIVVPLTAEAVKRIRSGAMRDPFDAEIKTDVAQSWPTAAAAYIGGIAGLGTAARAWALAYCESWLKQHSVPESFARPASEDGERAMRRWGYHPLPPPSRFWARDHSVTISTRPPLELQGRIFGASLHDDEQAE